MDSSRSEMPSGPSSKRMKLSSAVDDEGFTNGDVDDELDGDHCSICLQLLLDRTVIPECSHEFCFECIVTWTEQSRRCPLCTRTIGPYLIHNIRSNFDYQKYHLPPLRSSPPPIQPLRRARGSSIHRISARERRWGRRREQDVADELERAIDRRRWVYHNNLYAKHVGSNILSRYRPFPTPAQFAASQDYISRTTIFIRRELRVWPNLDVEFLTTFVLSLMKAIDVRSESAIKLLAEFLDMDRPYSEGGRFPNAEHFAHELYNFLRSPYKSLSAYDMNVQYDEPEGAYRQYNKTAPGRRANNEAMSDDESRMRRRSRERSRLSNGGGHSRTRLNDRDANDKFEGSSPSSPTTRVTTNGPGPSVPRNDYSDIETGKLHAIQVTADQAMNARPNNSNEHSVPRSRVNVESKRRTPLNREDLATHDHNGDRHDHVPDKTRDWRIDREVEEGQNSGKASVGADKRVSGGQTDDPSKQRAPNQNSSQSITAHSRIRNPLLIANAHLSEVRNNQRLEHPSLPPTRNEDTSPDLRRSSQSNNKYPSLLSRIGDPNLREVQTIEKTTDGSEPFLETSDKLQSVKPESQGIRAKLLQRLEAERAAQINREQKDERPMVVSQRVHSTDVSTPNSIPEEPDPSNIEARLRTRAHLRVKLIVEKRLNASNAQPGRTDDRVSEEKSDLSGSREEVLRSALENRRRGS